MLIQKYKKIFFQMSNTFGFSDGLHLTSLFFHSNHILKGGVHLAHHVFPRTTRTLRTLTPSCNVPSVRYVLRKILLPLFRCPTHASFCHLSSIRLKGVGHLAHLPVSQMDSTSQASSFIQILLIKGGVHLSYPISLLRVICVIRLIRDSDSLILNTPN
jgi:hypothetical protein